MKLYLKQLLIELLRNCIGLLHKTGFSRIVIDDLNGNYYWRGIILVINISYSTGEGKNSFSSYIPPYFIEVAICIFNASSISNTKGSPSLF